MFDILCVTSRLLCKEAFLSRIRRIAAAHPAGILLREKDLTEAEYRRLAEEVLAVCGEYRTPCILHGFPRVALLLGARGLHLPVRKLDALSPAERKQFPVLGASCHSAEEARQAEARGCTYITAGHIFDTDCKKGSPGRGLPFLEEVCAGVSVPVYAIGGITAERAAGVKAAGARGACVMSGIMQCADPQAYLAAFASALQGGAADNAASGVSFAGKEKAT